MADEEDSKSLRTTKEQIECYLNFVNSHPEIKLNKNDPKRSKRIEELWVNLTGQLNALKGPTRTAAKWKECLSHCKNQVRSRARKAKSHRMATGGGSCFQEELAPMEQRALHTLGTVVVDGMTDVPTIGTEIDILECTLQSCNNSKGSVLTSDISSDTPSTSRRRNNTSNEMFDNFFTLIKERNEEENKFRNESIKCFEKVAESMNNVATAILTLSHAIAENLNKEK